MIQNDPWVVRNLQVHASNKSKPDQQALQMFVKDNGLTAQMMKPDHLNLAASLPAYHGRLSISCIWQSKST